MNNRQIRYLAYILLIGFAIGTWLLLLHFSHKIRHISPLAAMRWTGATTAIVFTITGIAIGRKLPAPPQSGICLPGERDLKQSDVPRLAIYSIFYGIGLGGALALFTAL